MSIKQNISMNNIKSIILFIALIISLPANTDPVEEATEYQEFQGKWSQYYSGYVSYIYIQINI